MHAHARTVLVILARPPLPPTFSTAVRLNIQSIQYIRRWRINATRRGLKETPDDKEVLLYAHWTMWNSDRAGYRSREHVP